MKSLVFTLLILLSCVDTRNNKRSLYSNDPIRPPNSNSCSLGEGKVCGKILVKTSQIVCITNGPGCGEYGHSFVKMTFPSACHAQNNGALVLHQGNCADFCPAIVYQAPANFCVGGEIYWDYSSGGCLSQAKCRYFPCPLFQQSNFIETCPSGESYKTYRSSGDCYDAYSCAPNNNCPREYPPEMINCNSGRYSAAYDQNKCINNLTCAP